MTPEEKYELFEKHCSQELSINEKARLNKLIEEDKAVKKELRIYQELHLHLDASFNSEKEQELLKNNLKKIGGNFFSKRKPKENLRKEAKKEIQKESHKKSKVIRLPSWVYAVAASVVIIFGTYLFNQNDPEYSDFAEIPKLSIVSRGEEGRSVKNAENAFNSRNYMAAERYLFVLLSKDKGNAEYQFYYGISLLEQNKFNEATRVFEALYQGRSAYKHKAQWFEALNQLKQKKYNQCSTLLKNISTEAEDYSRAQELLNELD